MRLGIVKEISRAIQQHQVVWSFGMCQNISRAIKDIPLGGEYFKYREDLSTLMLQAIRYEAKLGESGLYPLELVGVGCSGKELYDIASASFCMSINSNNSGVGLWDKDTEYGRTRWKVWNRFVELVGETL